ncbi:hypothetical protein DKX38_027930 [Salix brachista]|uniref:Uncharacterized protein n=1 Tax=Salix brachista TaxID=2182728 RepID=A0A5N5J878_9ROSI|nr:hypothetical protein DKX38_027930 [Salix brachista]
MDMIAMKPCTFFSSTTSCIFAAVIWETKSRDSLVTDMKFRWVNLFAQGCQLVLCTCILHDLKEVAKSSVSGTMPSCLLLWNFLTIIFSSCNEALGTFFLSTLYISIFRLI